MTYYTNKEGKELYEKGHRCYLWTEKDINSEYKVVIDKKEVQTELCDDLYASPETNVTFIKVNNNFNLDIKLTNNEKLFILYTKCWFKDIENAKEIILADEYGLDIQQVKEKTIMHFTMGLYYKLYELGYILKNHQSPLMYMMEQVNRIGKSPLSPKSLYHILYIDIQSIETKGLELDKVLNLENENEINEALDKFREFYSNKKE